MAEQRLSLKTWRVLGVHRAFTATMLVNQPSNLSSACSNAVFANHFQWWFRRRFRCWRSLTIAQVTMVWQRDMISESAQRNSEARQHHVVVWVHVVVISAGCGLSRGNWDLWPRPWGRGHRWLDSGGHVGGGVVGRLHVGHFKLGDVRWEKTVR